MPRRSPDRTEKFGSFDSATGLPLTTADGATLSKSQNKAVAKELAKHTKSHEKLVGQAEGGDLEAHLQKLETNLDALKKE